MYKIVEVLTRDSRYKYYTLNANSQITGLKLT